MAAAPNRKHQDASENIGRCFADHIRPRRLGLVYRAPFAVLLPGESAVEPDLFFVSMARERILAERGCEGPPDLVVEIPSPSNTAHDLDVKRELYARFGIPEYLILDTDTETVWALTEPITDVNGGVYTVETLYHPSDVLTTAAVPGLTIAVADIFASRL
jgi:Uma2 family endonuclease